MSDEELLETYRASVNKAMDEASARDGFATNMSRESIVAGLRAVFDMSKGEKRAEDEREALIERIAGTIAVPWLVSHGTTWGDLVQRSRDPYMRDAREVLRVVEAAGYSKGPRPITDEMLGIMAQAFFEATGTPGSGIRYTRMIVKPEIVAGLRAALEAAEGARR